TLVAVTAGLRGRVLLGWTFGAILLLVFREPLDSLLNRAFGRRSADRRSAFGAALDRVRNSRGFVETAANVMREVRSGLPTNFAAVLRRENDQAFSDLFGQPTLTLREPSAILAVLRDDDAHLDLSPDGPIYQLLPADERRWLDRHRIHGCTPVR